MKFFTNKSIWSKIIIVLIFVLVFEFIVAKPTLGAEVTDDVVEGGGKLLTPVLSLVVTLGDALIGIAQSAIMGVDESIYPVDVDADFWEMLGNILVVAVAVVAAIVTIAGAIASGVGIVALIGTIGSALFHSAVGIVIGTTVVSIAANSHDAPISNVSASVFPDDIKVPATLYLPVYSYSPEEIFQGKILLFNVDFFGEPIEIQYNEEEDYYYYINDDNEEVKTSRQNIAADLSQTVSRWYVSIRNIALVCMMIILLYIGIRMLLATISSDKAKYRQMLQDWIMGLLLLFLMHYIMAFSVTLVQKLTDIVSASVDENVYAVKFPVDDNNKIAKFFDEKGMAYMLYDENGTQMVTSEGEEIGEGRYGEVAYVVYPTNLLGKLRLDLQFDSGGFNYVGYAICYLVLVFFTIYFTFVYLRRVLYMAFLTMIAPMVAMTYPIDKMNDGSAQGFTKWFREYIFNLLIQPMHLLLYFILIISAFELAGENIIYSIVAIGFMIPAEKLLRSLFGFEKASTPSALNGAAGAALVMGGVSKLSSIAGKGGHGGSTKSIGTSNNKNTGSGEDTPGKISLSGNIDAVSSMAQEGQEPMRGSGTTIQGGFTNEADKIAGDQQTLDELRKEATTPEQIAGLDEEQAQIDARRDRLNDAKKQEADRDKLETAKFAKDQMKERAKTKLSRPKRMANRAYVGVASRKKELLGAAAQIPRVASVATGVGLAAASGAVGIAAGVASGDPSDVLRNVAAGAGAGYLAGRGITNVDDKMSQLTQNATNLDKEQYYRQLALNEEYKDYAEQRLAKMKMSEYRKALKDNGFTRKEIKEKADDGTLNKYILNDVSAKDAATAELMRKENPEITQEQAITDAKYAARVGDNYKGPDRKKWQEHFSGEFQDKADLSKKQADDAAKVAMKRVDRFNKFKKKTI